MSRSTSGSSRVTIRSAWSRTGGARQPRKARSGACANGVAATPRRGAEGLAGRDPDTRHAARGLRRLVERRAGPGDDARHGRLPAGRDCAAEPRPGACRAPRRLAGIARGDRRERGRALGSEPLAAAIGPGIGPCCYEVGPDVAEPFEAAYGAEVLVDGRLDLWRAAELALERAGVEEIERTDLCTYCHPELFFSHRRDRGTTGRQGVIAAVT